MHLGHLVTQRAGMSTMKIMVTGGAGFIGSAMCRNLVGQMGATVLNIDKLTYASNLRSLDPIADRAGYHFRLADICDRVAMEAAFDQFRPDAVIHLAAETHVDRSITDSTRFMQANFLGTHTLLEVARAYLSSLAVKERAAFRFLHVSTDEVYGSLGPEGLFREDTRYNPSSPYSASKAASNHLVMAWHTTYGFPGIIANCCNSYGPYQYPEKFIPLMILNAREGRPLPVYGDGHNVRDWLYVEDHARALHLILIRGMFGETYNVGGRNAHTNLAVIERICDLLDRHHPAGAPHRRLVTFVTDRPGHDRRYAMDTSKLETELGWRPKEKFASGMDKTVRWYLENKSWWESMRRGAYKGERLGLLTSAKSAATGARP
jgi:dTDP-glucose 4,6-dehydratase